MSDFQVSVIRDDAPLGSGNLSVLRIAAAAKNSITQIFQKRPQVSKVQLEDLHAKVVAKLALHRIEDYQVCITLNFTNDRTLTFESFGAFAGYDLKTDLKTASVTFRWSFVFDPAGDGDEHLHSLLVRISEMPATGMILQRILSSNTYDLERSDDEMFSAVSCKIDFADGRFSSEVLNIVEKWVAAQPEAVPTFPTFKKLLNNHDEICGFIEKSFPVIVVAAYVGVWVGWLPEKYSASTKIAAAWVLVGGALFFLSKYVSELVAGYLKRSLRRMAFMPVFQITDGDKKRMLEYLARSQRSFFGVVAVGLVTGVAKAFGLWLASLVFSAGVGK